MPGTGERILEADYVKRIFTVSPVQANTYLDLKDTNDPTNANIELSFDPNPTFTGNVSINGIRPGPQFSTALTIKLQHN